MGDSSSWRQLLGWLVSHLVSQLVCLLTSVLGKYQQVLWRNVVYIDISNEQFNIRFLSPCRRLGDGELK